MSDPILARYDFLSFVRRGAAANLGSADPLSGPLPDRGRISVDLTVHATAGEEGQDFPAPAKVALHGPGDVVGIDSRHVIKTEPLAGTTNYEPNYLAGIEFDHPDFPWLFTPAAHAGDRLRPWLCLLALAEGEFTRPSVTEPLPAVQVTNGGALPNLSDSWAWAHAQVSGGLGSGEVGAMATSDPGRVLSRLLSPRRLRPLTRYTAFLVPAFDLGVKAGLGEKVPTAPGTQAAPAWNPGDAGKLLPVYYEFEFQTSDEGDFETLVRRLVPRELPAEVGMRQMLVDQPGWGVRSAGGPLGLGGALRSVQTVDTAWSGSDREAFEGDVTTLVNKAAAPLDDPKQDPVVVPPLYGRWHAARSTVSPGDSGWVGGLNTDPRPRTMAGFGTRVVLAERTQLMASAWRQVQGIEAANQLIRQARLAAVASSQILDKHLAKAPAELLLAITEPLHTRLLASPRTVAATVSASRLPSRALEPSFRRLAAPGGPIARRARGGGMRRILRRLAEGDLSAAPPLHNPDGFQSLEELAGGPGAEALPAWLRRFCGKHRLIAIVAVVLAAAIVLLGLLFGQLGPALVLVVLVVALLLAFAAWLRSRCGAAGGSLDFGDLRPEVVAEVPPRPGFTVEVGGQQVGGSGGAPGADSPAGAAVRTALEHLGAALPRPQEEPKKPGADIDGLAGGVLGKLNPVDTVGARVEAVVDVVGGAGGVVKWDEPLEEIMAAPEFPQPMYEPLRDLSQEYLLPGVELVPHDTLGLLLENHAFIESYMVGLNHEMGRELLWNNYPTDQRGSYFRQFWDVRGYVPQPGDPGDPEALRELLKDIPQVHRWPRKAPLGQHRNRPVTGGDRIVLLVRGELLKRYPNAVVYAAKAKWDPSKHRHDLAEGEKHPLYRGTLSPDLTFFGFDLTEEEALGNDKDHSDPDQGWFFVFQQRPGEPRFGLDPEPEPFAHRPVKKWSDLSWANFAASEADLEKLEHLPAGAGLHGSVSIKETPENPGDTANNWGKDAAQMAFIALRRPVRVAVHAQTMLP